MDAMKRIECLCELVDGRMRLSSPEVGLYAQAPAPGAVLVPGARLGVVLRLGVEFVLVVPPGASGVVVGEPPARLRHPVGHGDLLVELEPVSTGGVAQAASKPGSGANDLLVVKAPSSGRFWHRPAPGEPAFLAEGQRLEPREPETGLAGAVVAPADTQRPTAGGQVRQPLVPPHTRRGTPRQPGRRHRHQAACFGQARAGSAPGR